MPGLANANAVLENWIADFEYMRRTTEWGMLVYTFHPYVIGRGHRMLILEKLIDALGRMGAVFCTLMRCSASSARASHDTQHVLPPGQRRHPPRLALR